MTTGSGGPGKDSRLRSLLGSLRRFQDAGAKVAGTTTALLKGGAVIGNTISNEVSALSAKSHGKLKDYAVPRAYVPTKTQLDKLDSQLAKADEKLSLLLQGSDYYQPAINTLRNVVGPSSDARRERAHSISSFLGASPKEFFKYLATFNGGTVIGHLASENLQGVIIPMAEQLATMAPAIPEPVAIITGLLAASGRYALRVLELRGMERAGRYAEVRDQVEQRVLDQEQFAADWGHKFADAVEISGKARASFDKKYGREARVSPEGVALIKSMTADGAAPLEVFSAQSVSDRELIGKVGEKLQKGYLMSVEDASKVRLDLVADHGGDMPMIKRALHSREIPVEWVEKYGIDEYATVMKNDAQTSAAADAFNSFFEKVDSLKDKNSAAKPGMGP